jgi:hypothetical protein
MKVQVNNMIQDIIVKIKKTKVYRFNRWKDCQSRTVLPTFDSGKRDSQSNQNRWTPWCLSKTFLRFVINLWRDGFKW